MSTSSDLHFKISKSQDQEYTISKYTTFLQIPMTVLLVTENDQILRLPIYYK